MRVMTQTTSQTSTDTANASEQPNSQLQISRLLRIEEVKKVTGKARSSIYREIRERLFPAPIRIGARAVAWRELDILNWIKARSAGSFKAIEANQESFANGYQGAKRQDRRHDIKAEGR